MSQSTDAQFNGRQRRRLRNAREAGYLDAACDDNARLVKVFGLWCWRMRIPMIWFERRSAHSRYGALHLEMFTTLNLLTPAGQAALRALGEADVSAHGATWDSVARAEWDSLSRAVYRAVVATGNYRLNRASVKIDTRPGKLRMLPLRTA